MERSLSLLTGLLLLFSAPSLLAQERPFIDFSAYGQMLHQKQSDGRYATTLMLVPEFEFHLAPNVHFDLEVGVDYNKNSGSPDQNNVDIEEAALSIALTEAWSTRIGKMHLPVGVYNLYHEPIYFHSVFPSEVEQKIIPDEWHENGLLVSYQIGEGKLSGGVYGGLSQQHISSAEWMRGTSLEGKSNHPESYATILRYDYGNIDKGTLIGGTFYRSGMTGIDSVGKSEMTLWELHARKKFDNGIECDALFAQGRATKTAELSSVLGRVIGQKSQGWYANLAYDIAHKMDFEHSLPLFIRYEAFNTQAEVAQGLTADPMNDRRVTTIGLNYRPWPKVVLKTDYQMCDSRGSGGDANRIEFGAGFVY